MASVASRNVITGVLPEIRTSWPRCHATRRPTRMSSSPASASPWRLRVGDLRIVYLVEDTKRLVVILKVARRAESTYRCVGG
jgi:ParE toxin of type II toxin-antitoxin system, parDE